MARGFVQGQGICQGLPLQPPNLEGRLGEAEERVDPDRQWQNSSRVRLNSVRESQRGTRSYWQVRCLLRSHYIAIFLLCGRRLRKQHLVKRTRRRLRRLKTLNRWRVLLLLLQHFRPRIHMFSQSLFIQHDSPDFEHKMPTAKAKVIEHGDTADAQDCAAKCVAV